MPETKQLFSSPRCQHIHYSGKPCKAPARKGRQYCVFHQAAHLGSGGCALPIIEDLHSYQLAVIRIMQSLADDVIDSRKATALLYGLQLLGGKLKDFVKEREEVEDPRRALHNEISERYQARRYPLPNLPEEYLIPILKEMRAEQSAKQRADAPEPTPLPSAPVSTCHLERGQADAGGESESRDLHCPDSPPDVVDQPELRTTNHASAPCAMSPVPAPERPTANHDIDNQQPPTGDQQLPTDPPQSIGPSSDLRPPQHDTGPGFGLGQAGAA